MRRRCGALLAFRKPGAARSFQKGICRERGRQPEPAQPLAARRQDRWRGRRRVRLQRQDQRRPRQRQLDARLDLSQRLGANGKALLADTGVASASPPGAALDTGIKSARLRQLELANERAAAEAAAGSGRYVEAEAAKLEMGRIAGRMVAAFDGVLPDLADAVAAQSTLSQRDALHLLRGAWLASRSRLAGDDNASR
jgi:hypothetical protein